MPHKKPMFSKFKSKKDIVYDHLQTAILRGDYQPGERLVIDRLAAEFGVSQIPIREALQQLQSERFVVIEPHVGPRVANIEAGLIYEIFQLLQAFETISCRAACRSMTDADLDEMQQMLCQMDALVDDPEQWSLNNQRFHRALCLWGETRLVEDLMGHVLAQWDRLRHHYLKDVLLKRIELSQQDHWALYKALQARKADLAEQIVRQHNQRALADYITYLESTGQIPQKEQE